MEKPKVPPAAFMHPDGSNRRDVERLIQRALELVLDYTGSAMNRSPLPDPDGLPRKIGIPEKPAPPDRIFAALKALMDNSMNAAHPACMGHMDSIPTTMSVIGDLVVAALNNNMLSLEMSPVLSRLEVLLGREFARFFGLGDKSGGVMLSGGSLSNLEALTVARNVAFDARENGIAGLRKKPALFASELCHTSIHKAAMVLGLGTSAVIAVPADAQGRMDAAALRRAVAKAKKEGRRPFCIVATAGATMTGTVDPIAAAHEIARKNDCWLHVDAVYGGALMFSHKRRRRLDGIELADSITFNPQKWMYVTKVCSLLMFRDLSLLNSHFRVRAPYMRENDEFVNLGEINLHGTRHPDVLKLWLSLLHIGREGFGRIIDRTCELGEFFAEEVKRRTFLRLAYPPEMNIVCFRGEPERVSEDGRDEWNAGLQEYLLHKGNAFLSMPLLRGRRWLKAVLLNPYLDKSTLAAVFRHIDAYSCFFHKNGAA